MNDALKFENHDNKIPSGHFIFEFDRIPTPSNPEEEDTFAGLEMTFFTTNGDHKLISYLIYFDSGKDVVKPGSCGPLNEIAKVLFYG